jgi:hypothetical protein
VRPTIVGVYCRGERTRAYLVAGRYVCAKCGATVPVVE